MGSIDTLLLIFGRSTYGILIERSLWNLYYEVHVRYWLSFLVCLDLELLGNYHYIFIYLESCFFISIIDVYSILVTLTITKYS